MIGKDSVSFEALEVYGAKHWGRNISAIFGSSHEPKIWEDKLNNKDKKLLVIIFLCAF